LNIVECICGTHLHAIVSEVGRQLRRIFWNATELTKENRFRYLHDVKTCGKDNGKEKFRRDDGMGREMNISVILLRVRTSKEYVGNSCVIGPGDATWLYVYRRIFFNRVYTEGMLFCSFWFRPSRRKHQIDTFMRGL